MGLLLVFPDGLITPRLPQFSPGWRRGEAGEGGVGGEVGWGGLRARESLPNRNVVQVLEIRGGPDHLLPHT